MSFTATAPDGTTEIFAPASDTHQKARFAVGSANGPRGAVWNVNVSGVGDIYIGERSTMPTLKVSLHRSGVRRLAFEEKYAATHLPKAIDRKIAEWNPVDLAPGWIHELDIWVPAAHVNTIAPIVGKRGSLRRIVWLDKPPVGRAVVFRFVTCRPLHPDYRRIQFQQFGKMDIAVLWLNRPAGPEACAIIATEMELTEGQDTYLRNLGQDLANYDSQLRYQLHAKGRRTVMFDASSTPPRLIDQSLVL